MGRFHSWRASRAPLAIAVLVAACADGSSPTAPPPAPPLGRARISASYAQTDGAGITLVGDDGVALRLDAARARIYSSTGSVIELTAEQNVQAANAFTAAYDGEQVSLALAGAANEAPPREPTCQAAGEMCHGGEDNAFGGVGAFGGGPIAGAGQPGAGEPGAGEPGTGGPAARPPFFVRPYTPADDAPVLGATGDGGATLQFMQPFSCGNIATAIYLATLEFRQRQAGLSRTYREVAGQVGISPVTGTYRLPVVGEAAVRVEVAIAEQARASLNLNILATLYASYGCWNNGAWRGSPGTSYIPSSPNFVKVCHTEAKMFSLDGIKYVKVFVTECEIRMQ